jgi:hypothetical protein
MYIHKYIGINLKVNGIISNDVKKERNEHNLLKSISNMEVKNYENILKLKTELFENSTKTEKTLEFFFENMITESQLKSEDINILKNIFNEMKIDVKNNRIFFENSIQGIKSTSENLKKNQIQQGIIICIIFIILRTFMLACIHLYVRLYT